MTKQEKRQLRLVICGLLDECEGCERIVNIASYNLNDICLHDCEHGQKIEFLGRRLYGNKDTERLKPKVRGKKPTKEEYLSYKKKGWSDKQIYTHLNISKTAMLRLKHKWGLIGQKRVVDKNKYLKLKEEGLPLYKIAERLGVSRTTLNSRRKEWGIE